jgi:hypothetical protein
MTSQQAAKACLLASDLTYEWVRYAEAKLSEVPGFRGIIYSYDNPRGHKTVGLHFDRRKSAVVGKGRTLPEALEGALREMAR